VQGTASDLLLLLWRRRSPADVTVFGDVSVLDRFLIRTDLD
jgi:MDMPI C-terminal domain